ncbi:DUF7667 family protein [Brevibacillus borstelensis]|jgi:hypothetical protein|uniref:DUF7667 family protein n=1 Tax=Brevibacillus borstelensis TaxID=45462 RepID=UPI00242F6835|nr:hypothetical protein [Brevibacillus borstelensis]
MPVVENRLLELVGFMLKRQLTHDEWRELKHCHTALVNKQWKLNCLLTMSQLAHISEDVEWQHDICREIDKLTLY